MSVTVNKGALLSQKYKGSTVTNDLVELVGDEMSIQDGKVTMYNGQVLKKDDKTNIGNFQYANDGESYYNCNVAITDSKNARLQINAITALLDGVAQFETEEMSV